MLRAGKEADLRPGFSLYHNAAERQNNNKCFECRSKIGLKTVYETFVALRSNEYIFEMLRLEYGVHDSKNFYVCEECFDVVLARSFLYEGEKRRGFCV